MRRLLWPLVWLVNMGLVYGSDRKRVHGILVSCSVVDADCHQFFEKTERALQLIRNFDERRLNRMRRDIKAIGLAKRGSCYFESSVRAIFLDASTFPTATDEAIAGALIHEATHARLFRAGHRNYSANKERHELICVREELTFLRRLPGAGALAKRLEDELQQPWWGEEGRQVRIARFTAAYGFPDWLRRFLIRFGAR